MKITVERDYKSNEDWSYGKLTKHDDNLNQTVEFILNEDEYWKICYFIMGIIER